MIYLKVESINVWNHEQKHMNGTTRIPEVLKRFKLVITFLYENVGRLGVNNTKSSCCLLVYLVIFLGTSNIDHCAISMGDHGQERVIWMGNLCKIFLVAVSVRRQKHKRDARSALFAEGTHLWFHRMDQ